MDTKACSLTEDEVKAVIASHAVRMLNQPNVENSDIDNHVDRMVYLNKRLKAFKEEAPKIEEQPKAQITDAQVDVVNQAAAANPVKDGW